MHTRTPGRLPLFHAAGRQMPWTQQLHGEGRRRCTQCLGARQRQARRGPHLAVQLEARAHQCVGPLRVPARPEGQPEVAVPPVAGAAGLGGDIPGMVG